MTDTYNLFQNLAKPTFIKENPQEVTKSLIDLFEKATGRTLYPAQIERLEIDLLAYLETVLRISLNNALRQNLVAYAKGDFLDHLGLTRLTPRLPAQKALTTLRFTKVQGIADPLTIAKDTAVLGPNDIAFTTNETLILSPHDGEGSVGATAQQAGLLSNDLPIGSVDTLVHPIAYIDTVENTTISSNGTDIESDDRYRKRVLLAPNLYSKAGPKNGYRALVLAVSNAITDCAILSPHPNEINIYALTKSGPAPQALKDKILASLPPKDKRPMGDILSTHDPKPTQYQLKALIWTRIGFNPQQVIAQVKHEIETLTKQKSLTLGRDLVPSQFIDVLQSINGVWRVVLDSPKFQTVQAFQYAQCTRIDIQDKGISDET